MVHVLTIFRNGKVAQGCLSILSELPIVKVPVSQLESLVNNPDTDLKKVRLSNFLAVTSLKIGL